jgi:hypothetical protein
MNVYEAEAATHEPMGFDQTHDLIISGYDGLRKRAEKDRDPRPGGFSLALVRPLLSNNFTFYG